MRQWSRSRWCRWTRILNCDAESYSGWHNWDWLRVIWMATAKDAEVSRRAGASIKRREIIWQEISEFSEKGYLLFIIWSDKTSPGVFGIEQNSTQNSLHLNTFILWTARTTWGAAAEWSEWYVYYDKEQSWKKKPVHHHHHQHLEEGSKGRWAEELCGDIMEISYNFGLRYRQVFAIAPIPIADRLDGRTVYSVLHRLSCEQEAGEEERSQFNESMLSGEWRY